MIVTYHLTDKEKELLIAIKEQQPFLVENTYKICSGPAEIWELEKYKLVEIYHGIVGKRLYLLTELGEDVYIRVAKKPKVRSVQQIAEIRTLGGTIFPLDRRVRFELDKDHLVQNKRHLIVFQQKEQYGEPGDFCTTINHNELFELETAGMIIINPKIEL